MKKLAVKLRHKRQPELRKKDKNQKLSVLLKRLPLPKNLQKGKKEKPLNRKPRQRWLLVSPKLNKKGLRLRSKLLVLIKRHAMLLPELLNSRKKNRYAKPKKKDANRQQKS